MDYPHPAQAGPYASFPIREQVLYIPLRQACRINRVIAVTNESSVLAVQLEQTGTVCCKPQCAVPVFCQ